MNLFSSEPDQQQTYLIDAIAIPVVTPQPGFDPRVSFFRRAAENLQKTIDDKRRDSSQNPTPKRMRQERQRRVEADGLERVQRALRAIADAREAGTLPAVLSAVKTKAEIAKLVAKKMKHNGGYYDAYYETDQYADASETGKAMQRLLENKSPEQEKADAEREAQARINELEDRVRFVNIPGFFPTPRPVIERLADVAFIEPGMSVLEPSAGKGDILDVLRERHPDAILNGLEYQHCLAEIARAKGHDVATGDFLEHRGQYDRIVMNPPFEKGQEIDHVRHAFSLLKPGGRIIAVMSEGPFHRSDRKAIEFREWLESAGGQTERLAAGSFAGRDAFRQTGTATRRVVVDKAL